MTILTHAVIGGLVGVSSPNIFLSAFLGFISHFVFDIVPHNDYIYFYFEKKENPYISWTSRIILVITFVYLVSLFWIQPQEVYLKALVGSVSAMVPDILTGTWTTFGWKSSRFDRIHSLTHQRLTIAERFYGYLSPKNRFSKKNLLTANFNIIKNSKMARFGWGLELLTEIILLIFCLFRLGFLV